MASYEASLAPKYRRALCAVRPILEAAGQPAPDMRNFYIGDDAVREYSNYEGLTETISEYDMPEIASSTILDHYTKSAAYKGIIGSRQLWLAPVTLRLGQGEMEAFANEHGLYGYVDASGHQTQSLKEAAANLFYTSFTRPIPSEKHWDVFGEGGNGYRLRFEVSPGVARLRAIRYQTAITLLRQINDALVQAGLPRFIMKGISRVPAFYLPQSLEEENEVRLLAKRFPGGGAPVVAGALSEHWPIPIGVENVTAELKLIQIGVRRLDAAVVSSKLPAWCSGVPVVADR